MSELNAFSQAQPLHETSYSSLLEPEPDINIFVHLGTPNCGFWECKYELHNYGLHELGQIEQSVGTGEPRVAVSIMASGRR